MKLLLRNFWFSGLTYVVMLTSRKFSKAIRMHAFHMRAFILSCDRRRMFILPCKLECYNSVSLIGLFLSYFYHKTWHSVRCKLIGIFMNGKHVCRRQRMLNMHAVASFDIGLSCSRSSTYKSVNRFFREA
jgi:hypothetical protein